MSRSESAPAGAPARTGVRTWARVGAVGVVLIAALAAIYLWLTEHPVHTRVGAQFVVDRLNDQLAGHQVVAATAELRWQPGPRVIELDLQRVHLQNAPGEVFIVAGAARIQVPFRRLVVGDFSPAHVAIDTPRMHLVRTESGERFLREIDGVGRMPAAALLVAFAGGGGASFGTTVQDSEVRFSEEGTGAEWRWEMGSVQYESHAGGGTVELSAKISDPIGRTHAAQVDANWDDADTITAEYRSVPLGLLVAELSGRSQLAEPWPVIATGALQASVSSGWAQPEVTGTFATEPVTIPTSAWGDVELGAVDVEFELPSPLDRMELTSVAFTAEDRLVSGRATVRLDPSKQVTGVDGQAELRLTGAGWEMPGGTVWRIAVAGSYSPEHNSLSVTGGQVAVDLLSDGTRETLELASTVQVDLSSDGALASAAGRLSISPTVLELGPLGEVEFDRADLQIAYSGESGLVHISDVRVRSALGSLDGGMEFMYESGQREATTPMMGRLWIDQLMLTERSPWGQGLRIGDYETSVSYRPESMTLELATANARIGSSAAALGVRLVNLTQPDAEVDLRIELTDAAPSELRELWPPWIAPTGRTWFFENTPAGAIDAQVSVVGALADPHPTIEVNFRELDIRYLPTMPPIEAAAGSGRITREAFTAQLHEGELSIGDGTIDVRGSGVEFSGISGAVPWATVRLAAAAEVAALTRLLEFAPIRLSQRSGIRLQPTGGRAVAAATLEFPLLQRLDLAEVEYDISVQLADIALPSGWSDVEVQDGSGTLNARDGELTMAGTFRVRGADVTLDLRTESDPALSAGTTQYVMDGTASLSAPIRRGTAVIDGGAATFAVRARTRLEQSAEYELEVDLAELAIDLGTAAAKPRGEPGRLNAMGDISADGSATADVSLELPGLQAGGPVEFSPVGMAMDLAGTVAADHLGRAAQYLEPNAEVAGTLRLEPIAEGRSTVALAFDLTPHRVTLPETGIVKPPGRPGGLQVGGEVHGQGVLLHTVAFELGPIQADGKMHLDDAGEFRSASFGEVRVGERSRLAVQVRREPDTATYVSLFGDVLDLQEIRRLHDPEDAAEVPVAESESPVTATALREPLVVDARLRRVHFAQDIWLEDVAGRVTARSSSDVNGTLSGQAFGELDASLEFGTADGELQQVLRIDNAGEVLDALGYTSTISGGRIRISRGFTAADAEANRRLVELLDVDVHNAPVFAQLLSFVSGIGLVEYIVAGNTAFSTIRMVVEEDGDLLRFTDGVAESASMGFIFVGDLHRTTGALEVHGYATPVRFLTRVLGEIPILGLLVEGDEGESTLGVGFTVTGTVDDPETNVQPLSLLVPFLPRLQNLETSSGTGADAPPDESATEPSPPAN